jgi:hypothetical protein
MKLVKWIAPALVGAGLAMAPMAASADSPVFGKAKVASLSSKDMSKVVGKYSAADYYGYYGYYYSYYAYLYGYYGTYYNSTTYYYYAYYYAYYAYLYLYYAYYYASQGN